MEAPARRDREGPRARGYGTRWERARKRQLELEPWCRACRGPGKDVDHVIPHRGAEWLFWLEGNLQTLCHRDHSRKTVQEREGIPIGMIYPLDLPSPSRPFRLLCGPDVDVVSHVGQGRGVLNGYAMEGRPEARNAYLHAFLEEETGRPCTVVLPAPRTAERAFWSHVLQTEAQLILPAIEGEPLDWWGPYDMDRKAEAEMRRRGWTG